VHRVGVIERWAVRAALATALVGAATQLIDFGFFDLRVRWLDQTTHASVFGVLSVLALAVAVAFALALAAARGVGDRRLLFLPPLLSILLVLRVEHPLHVLLYALPFAAATFAVLWTLDAATGAARLVRLGCLSLVGSYAVHAAGTSIVSHLGYGPQTWPYQVKLVTKHSGEIAGWMLVAAGLLSALARELARRPQEPSLSVT
jgi:hypothetical protein